MNISGTNSYNLQNSDSFDKDPEHQEAMYMIQPRLRAILTLLMENDIMTGRNEI